jgi:sarcosine oxidase/L-pipecolate oxidase
MPHSKRATKTDPVVIIGAGVFGLSTALELKLRGYESVTVIDRYMPPVPDGSSVDISRIIRSEYADPLYARMANEAIEGWKTNYRRFYHESGFVILTEATANGYVQRIQEVNEGQNTSLNEYADANDIKNLYPNVQAKLCGLRAYHNPSGGWADAESSIKHLATLCGSKGVSFQFGPKGTATALEKEGSQVTGVSVMQGPSIAASQVILATGAWTNLLVDMTHTTSASGQPVGFIQLTPEEALSLQGSPVMINLTTGIFCFPPSPSTNILKVARHGYGYATSMSVQGSNATISSPFRDLNNAEHDFLPTDAERDLRLGLKQLLPQFSNHPWKSQRLCWYTDTPEGDFVVGHHPTVSGLFMATGGSGQYVVFQSPPPEHEQMLTLGIAVPSNFYLFWGRTSAIASKNLPTCP